MPKSETYRSGELGAFLCQEELYNQLAKMRPEFADATVANLRESQPRLWPSYTTEQKRIEQLETANLLLRKHLEVKENGSPLKNRPLL